MSEETVFYQNQHIRITNSRAIIGSKTYAMANITSVNVHKVPGNPLLGIIVAVGGVILAACGLPVYFGELLPGILGAIITIGIALGGLTILVIGIALAVTVRSSYCVRIGSASGEANMLTSKSEEHATKIVNAMNQAIVQRG